MAKEISKETKKILTEGEELFHMFQSTGWKIAMERLNKLLIDTDSTSNVDAKQSADDIKKEIIAKKTAIDIVMKWFEEVRGLASQHKDQNINFLRDLRQGKDIIKRFD